MNRRAFLTAFVAVLALPVAACSVLASGTGRGAFDQQFIDMMVPHHQGAVEMAKLAEQRARRPEIKQMSADIIRSQSGEIEQLKGWRKAWFGSDQTPPMSQMPVVEDMSMSASGKHATGHGEGAATAGQTMDMAADVEKLRRADEPFDRAFIDAMIPHHESAIAAAQAAETRAQRAEIRQLAREIIAAQEREIGQMREWRRAWYGA